MQDVSYDYDCLHIMASVFFFSSRRRHTRYWRDWSSDVCSSDLHRLAVGKMGLLVPDHELQRGGIGRILAGRHKIGRASCREKVWHRVVGVFTDNVTTEDVVELVSDIYSRQTWTTNAHSVSDTTN